MENMTDDEIIAVVQAHKEGKRIQCSLPHGDWFDWPNVIAPYGDFIHSNWRVKPEPRKPREWWVHVKTGEIRSCLSNDGIYSHSLQDETIRVREVLE